jgi:hypothetical protein
VFSARTTEEGLKTLNELKARLGVGWDGLVIDAVSAHYGVDIPKPPRAGRTARARGRGKKAKAEGQRGGKGSERQPFSGKQD